jgi:hypothetical protein
LKLSASIDLTAKRAEVTDFINRWFDDQSKKVGSPVPEIHQAKLRVAQSVKGRSAPPAALVAEAKRRNVSVDALCDLIVQKDAAMVDALVALDGKRQALLDAVSVAKGEQEIIAIKGRVTE